MFAVQTAYYRAYTIPGLTYKPGSIFYTFTDRRSVEKARRYGTKMEAVRQGRETGKPCLAMLLFKNGSERPRSVAECLIVRTAYHMHTILSVRPEHSKVFIFPSKKVKRDSDIQYLEPVGVVPPPSRGIMLECLSSRSTNDSTTRSFSATSGPPSKGVLITTPSLSATAHASSGRSREAGGLRAKKHWHIAPWNRTKKREKKCRSENNAIVFFVFYVREEEEEKGVRTKKKQRCYDGIFSFFLHG